MVKINQAYFFQKRGLTKFFKLLGAKFKASKVGLKKATLGFLPTKTQGWFRGVPEGSPSLGPGPFKKGLFYQLLGKFNQHYFKTIGLKERRITKKGFIFSQQKDYQDLNQAFIGLVL